MVTDDGKSLVSHAGTALLAELADLTGLAGVCAQDCVPQTNCFVSSATSSKFCLMSGKDWLPSR